MKRILAISLLLCLGNKCLGQELNDLRETVYKLWGDEKSKAFQNMIETVDIILSEKFKELPDSLRMKEFLKEYLSGEIIDLDDPRMKEAYFQLNSTGMRSEFYLIADEMYFGQGEKQYWEFRTSSDYNSVQLDSGTQENGFEDIHVEMTPEEHEVELQRETEWEERRKVYLRDNLEGKFFWALSKKENQNPLIKNYLNAIREMPDIYKPLIASSILDNWDEFQESIWFGKAVVVKEIVYPIVHQLYYLPDKE